MKKAFSILTVATSLLFVVVALAHDKVVVIPLGGSSPAIAEGTVTSAGGQVWMNRNLGASRVAVSSTDSAAYGDLYQWGRLNDGHENTTSLTISPLSTTDVPGHGSFIEAANAPYDWLNPQNDNLWQGVTGKNNPCPSGFRLPTEAEWDIERLSWSTDDAAGAFGSPLKLVLAGHRKIIGGIVDKVGVSGNYWTSNVDGSKARSVFFQGSSGATIFSNNRAIGFSVRCIKD